MNAALIIIAATLLGVLSLGLLARRGMNMDLEQWTVGGRSFGTASELYGYITFASSRLRLYSELVTSRDNQ